MQQEAQPMTIARPHARRLSLAALGWIACAHLGSVVSRAADTALEPAARSSPAPELSDRELAWHVLSRLGYGPRPGQVDEVLALGVDRYISEQLASASPAQPALEKRLADLPTLGLSPQELAERFAADQEARKERKERRRAKDEEVPGSGAMERKDQTLADLDSPRRLVAELATAKLLRATLGERQLGEVMADFWFNHFNVDARKGRPMPYLLGAHEAALREHELGRFEDLLIATAKSPAMLFYLDNWLSVDAESATRLRERQEERRGFLARLLRRDTKGKGGFLGKAKGLNENYARELLELHTLGVDGGYTQKDVQEVARCFTGWSLRKPADGSVFVFRVELHDRGEKVVLGHRIEAGGGINDGLQVLRLLAHHPSTARHISRELAGRFVSDEPPPRLVEELAAKFQQSDGDIREVLAALFASPEFRSRAAFQAKVKTPYEFVVSALRATGVAPDTTHPALLKALRDLGEPLYLCQPPTGYSDVASTWVSPGAMVARMTFAGRLAAGRIEGLEEPARLGTDVDDPSALARRLLGFDGSPEVVQALGGGERRAVALVLGSPDFQKR
jgi:uncharacterized protein (DUF1800 family)